MRPIQSKRIVACVLIAGTLVWGRSLISAQGESRPTVSFAHDDAGGSSAIDKYCASCHNGGLRSPSGTLLVRFNRTETSADMWARAYRQLQASAMPPVGSPRPDRATVDAMLASIEQALGAHATPASPHGREIATRLASMLWNSSPDAALLDDAQRNHLSDPAVLERQIRRMLADDRAQAFVASFFFPWLQLDTLASADPGSARAVERGL